MIPKEGIAVVLLTWLMCVQLTSADITASQELEMRTAIATTQGFVEGLGKSKEAVDLMQFSSDLGKVQHFASKMTPLLNVMGPLTTLVLLALPNPQDRFIAEVRNQFTEVHRKLDLIMDRLNHVPSTIAWHTTRTQFYVYVRKINHAKKNLVDIASPGNKDAAKNRFIDEYRHEYDSAGKHVKDMVVGTDNLLQLYKDFTENYRGKVIQFMQQTLKQLLEAAEVEVAYASLNGESERRQGQIVAEWEGYINLVQDKMKDIDQYDINEAERFAERRINENNDLHPRELTQNVADYLNCKYYWKKWFVMCYKTLGPDASFDWHTGKEFNIYATLVNVRRRFLITYTDLNRNFHQPTAWTGLDDYKKSQAQKKSCSSWWGRRSCYYYFPDKGSGTCRNNNRYAHIIRSDVKGRNLQQDLAFVIQHCHDTWISASDGSLAKMYNVHRCDEGDCSEYIVALFG